MSSSGGTCCVLGVDCYAGSLDEAATAVVDRALSGEGGFATLLNVHVAMTAQRDPAVLAALQGSWRVFPDGAPIAWLQKKQGAASAGRVPGPDLMLSVARRSPSHLRHYLFGSTPAVVAALSASLRRAAPAFNLAGSLAPEPGAERDEAVVERVRAAEPHIVWVGLGAPKQELWAQMHAPLLAPALIVGVGAAFDFHAGTKARAPEWMQRAGLEWLHRLLHEPRRLWWRYLSTNSRLVALVISQEIRDRFSVKYL